MLKVAGWPGHRTRSAGRLAVVGSFTVKLAQFVTLLQEPVTTTQNVPALAIVTEPRLNMSPVAPGISTPSLLH